MKYIIWRVRVAEPPPVARHCKKCGAQTDFVSSGLFRVNAQKKSLDVWLIYRCRHCDTTWNMAVLSRASRDAIAPDMLAAFYANDSGLALSVACDSELIRRRGGVPGLPVIAVEGPEVSLPQATRLEIIPQHPLEITAAQLLRLQLALSRKEFDALCASGAIRCPLGRDLRRCKLTAPTVVVLG